MANFLNQSYGDVVQSLAAADQNRANAGAINLNTDIKRQSSNALVSQYGAQAADPVMWGQAVDASTNAALQPDKVESADLALDQAKRADAAWQGQHAISFIKQQVDNGVPIEQAVGNLSPDTYKALGVSSDQVQGLVNAVKQNPAVLDQISDALTGDAAQSTMAGSVQWASDKDGKYHALYPVKDKSGNISYQEPSDLPDGYSLLGSTPAQATAAEAKGVKASQGAAEYASDLKPEDYFAAVQKIFPNAIMTGGARSAGTNASVGGAPNSMHLSGQALDFKVPDGKGGFLPGSQVFQKLRDAGLPMTESLDEGQVGSQGPHLHVGWAPKATAAQKNLDNGTTAATIALRTQAQVELRKLSASSGGSFSPQTVDYLADQFRTTGKLPALGLGGGPLRAAILDRAAQKAAAEGANGQADVFRAQATHERATAVTDLGKSTPNSAGGRVSSANALVTHLDQLSGLATGLTSGNLPAINAAKQSYMQATGNPAPTNFNAVKNIAADEAVKFIVANGGTLHDREQAQKMFDAAQSPQQLAGAITQVQHLAAGQLGGMRQRYQAIGATNEFDATLTPRSKQLLGLGQPTHAPAAASPTAALRAKYGM